MQMNDSALNDISYIRLALLESTVAQAEKQPLQRVLSRRKSQLDLAGLLYSVCGGEPLPELCIDPEPQKNPESPEPQKKPQPEAPAPETSALFGFIGKAGENMLREAAQQAARTGKLDQNSAKRAAVSGIARTISLMMREDRDK